MAATPPSTPTPPTRPASPKPARRVPIVLPAGRRREAPPLILDEAGNAPGPGPATAVEAMGERLQPVLACLRTFHRELGDAVSELRESVADDSRAALARRVGQLAKILEWTEAVAADLHDGLLRAASGELPVVTTDCMRDLAIQLEGQHSRMRVTVTAEPVRACWGRPEVLSELLRLALELSSKRIGDEGAITVSIEESAGVVHHRILGLGDPCPLDAPGTVERFAELLEASGATVTPDALGPGGTGMIVDVPVGEPS